MCVRVLHKKHLSQKKKLQQTSFSDGASLVPNFPFYRNEAQKSPENPPEIIIVVMQNLGWSTTEKKQKLEEKKIIIHSLI